jgi:hypothetical protein
MMNLGKSLILTLLATVLAGLHPLPAWADEPARLSDTEFEKLHRELQPPTDELWRTIPWKLEIVEACSQAAREKKAVVLRVRSGHPLGCV